MIKEESWWFWKDKKSLLKLQNKKSMLVDNFLEGNISKEIYKMKLLEIEKQEAELEKKLQPEQEITKENIQKLKKRAEFFVGIKKELHVAENRLMKLLEKLHFHLWYTRQGSNPR